MSTLQRLADDRLLEHARATAQVTEAHAPIAEQVGPDKLRRWASRSMMAMLHVEHCVYSPEQLVAYSDAYTTGYQEAHAARLAEHADAVARA